MYGSANWLYKQAFGVSPGPDVQILDKRHILGTDHSCFYLKFRINEKSLSDLVEGRFSELSRSEFDSEVHSTSEWFRTSAKHGNAYYRYRETEYGKGDLNVLVSYDDVNQVADVSHIRIY